MLIYKVRRLERVNKYCQIKKKILTKVNYSPVVYFYFVHSSPKFKNKKRSCKTQPLTAATVNSRHTVSGLQGMAFCPVSCGLLWRQLHHRVTMMMSAAEGSCWTPVRSGTDDPITARRRVWRGSRVSGHGGHTVTLSGAQCWTHTHAHTHTGWICSCHTDTAFCLFSLNYLIISQF